MKHIWDWWRPRLLTHVPLTSHAHIHPNRMLDMLTRVARVQSFNFQFAWLNGVMWSQVGSQERERGSVCV